LERTIRVRVRVRVRGRVIDLREYDGLCQAVHERIRTVANSVSLGLHRN